MSELLTKHELAKRLGVQREAIAKAVRSGRLDKSRHGDRFDFAVALHEWNAGRGHGAGSPDTRDGSIAEERRQWLRAKRQVEEYRLAVLAGRYVERQASADALTVLVGNARTTLEGIASAVKTECPEVSVRALLVIQRKVHDALVELSGASAEEGAA